MKRISIIVVMIIAIVSICTCFVLANDVEEPVTDPLNDDYVEASSITARLNATNGNAICKTKVDVISTSPSNKMVVTVKYIKQNVGTVGTRTATAYRSGVSFTATTNMTLTSNGSYHCKVTVQLYNGSTLLESVNVLTNTISY